jgi:hypothetical protein
MLLQYGSHKGILSPEEIPARAINSKVAQYPVTDSMYVNFTHLGHVGFNPAIPWSEIQ